MFLTRSGRVIANWREIGIVATAVAGVVLFGCQYEYLATLSQSQDYAERLRRGEIKPSYDLKTLSWQIASATTFDVDGDGASLVTGTEPYAYQAYATVEVGRATAADIQFEADVQSGGVSVGLLQGGKWIATTSSQHTGALSDATSARLGFNRSLTVVIANNNPSGTSHARLQSLRLYLRR